MEMLRYLFRRSSGAGVVDVPKGARAFSYHQKSGMAAIVFALLLAAMVELVVVHYFVAMWNSWAAWILTISSAWVMLTIIAQLRTIAWRPHFLHEGTLVLRNGMYELARIPVDDIERVEKSNVMPDNESDMPKPLQICVPVNHNVVIHLKKNCEATLLYWQRRDFRVALLFVDDVAGFCDQFSEQDG